MRSSTALLAAIFMLVCPALPVPALELNVSTVCDKSLFIDLGPSFEIVSNRFDDSSKGMISNDITISDTAQAGSAYVYVMTIFDKILSMMNPDALSGLLQAAGIEAVGEEGHREIGQWTALDSRGRNVSVTTMKAANESERVPGGIYNISVWNLDSRTYILMVSSFDENNTTQIIKTLTIS